METIIISSEFYFKAPYCELTSDAKLLYAHLYTAILHRKTYHARKKTQPNYYTAQKALPVKRFAASKI